MEQVKTLCKGIDEFLVLGSILTQVNLRLAVAWVVVVLALGEEEVVRLIVVLIEDGQVDFLCQFPASIEVRIAGV